MGLCITLSLVLVFGSLNSSSFTLPKTAFASDDADHTTGDSGGGDNSNHGDDNQGGDSGDQGNDHGDGSQGMPPAEDAPAATDTKTAGGGGSDDDEDDNDNNDNDNDNDNDNPQIPKDAPATPDALTAKKLECLPGQQVTLFSTTCEPAGGGAGSTQGTTSAATVCPPSPTPTSYGMSDGLSVMNTVWGYSEPDSDQHEMQKSLLHTVQSSTTEDDPEDRLINCPPDLPPAHPWPSVLPFRGDEPKLIDFYAMPVPDPESYRMTKTSAGSTFTFKDHTIRTSSQEPNVGGDDPISRAGTIDKTIITPGLGTPLDGLQVDRVEQTSTISAYGHRDPAKTETTIKYKDGKKIDYRGDLQQVKLDDGKGNIQRFNFNPWTGDVNVHKPDGSYTVYPTPGTGNAYTVYPRAPDGTQKTVTMTSQGEPILTVRDANDNIIPPKQ